MFFKASDINRKMNLFIIFVQERRWLLTSHPFTFPSNIFSSCHLHTNISLFWINLFYNSIKSLLCAIFPSISAHIKAEQRSLLVLFQRLMVIGLIGWHGLTYIKNYRSLVTTVTYNPSQHGCGCYADVPLMFLQYCFQISTPQCWFRAKKKNSFQPEFMILKLYALLKFKFTPYNMYLYFILPTLPTALRGLKEGVRCVLAFSHPQFSFLILCLKCPSNFSCREDARIEERTRNTFTVVGGVLIFFGAGRGCEVRRVVVGV